MMSEYSIVPIVLLFDNQSKWYVKSQFMQWETCRQCKRTDWPTRIMLQHKILLYSKWYSWTPMHGNWWLCPILSQLWPIPLSFCHISLKKVQLKVVKFETMADLQNAVQETLLSMVKHRFAIVLHAWVDRHEKCAVAGDTCFQKD